MKSLLVKFLSLVCILGISASANADIREVWTCTIAVPRGFGYVDSFPRGGRKQGLYSLNFFGSERGRDLFIYVI